METYNHCGLVEYNMFLVIEGAHFAGLATPANPASKECPSVVFHAKSLHNEPIQKVVAIAAEEEVADIAEEAKHHLGSRPLVSLIEAFESVEAGKDGAKFYDAVTNNCVSLLRNMADPLKIDIDDRMIGFISQRLLASTADHMFEKIFRSDSLNALMKGGNRMLKGVGYDKEKVLANLIKNYI